MQDNHTAQLTELGFHRGQQVVGRDGEVREVVGVEMQGASRTTAVKVRSVATGTVRRLMPGTLTPVEATTSEAER